MKKVFIAAGCPHATVTLYRCLHLQEQFAALGIEATVRDWQENPNQAWIDEALQADLIVLQRVPINENVRRLIETARQLGKQIAFDTDDLIFEPQMTGWHRGVANLSPAEQSLYQEGVQRYLATLEASDYVITASPLLAEMAQRRGKPAFVHRNAVGSEMQRLGDKLFAQRQQRPSSQKVVIGYGSGTPTHDADFEQAALALVDVLTRHPQVELWLVGPLKLPTVLEIFQNRIRRFPLGSWQDWFEIAAQFDISLAPLEPNNLFCRAKSEIKFVEAALLGVATVASRIDPFAHAIINGENGLLAGNLVEWMDALNRLVAQPALRHKLAERARSTIAERYSLQARTADLIQLLAQFPKDAVSQDAVSQDAVSQDAVSQDAVPQDAVSQDVLPPTQTIHNTGHEEILVPLVINWLVSEPFQGSGGHLGIFRMVKHLVDFGHECHIYILPIHEMHNYTPQQLREYVDRYFLSTGATFHQWHGYVGAADATVATYWKTVAELQKLPNPGRRYYLVQDFEPYFYAVGSEYLLCENTYRAGLHCLTLGPWLEKLLRERYQTTADHFDFAIDPEIYSPQPNPRQPWQRVLFYARPSTARRGYELGVAALEIVKARKPEVEIVLFGANQLDPLPFQYTLMGIRSPHELASLYSSSDVGLVLSLTNPSFVPFEMMACRCPVVDIRSERLEGLLEDRVNALLAEPTPEALATAVLELLDNQSLRERLIDNALERVNALSWRNSARQIEHTLLRHAPAAEARTATLRTKHSDASTLLWQIQQLLDHSEQQFTHSEQLQAKLEQLLSEKATMSLELAACQGKSLPASGISSVARDSVQALRSVAQTQLPVHKLGNDLLTKLYFAAQPIAQTFQAERSHLASIELRFALEGKSIAGMVRCVLVDNANPSQPIIDTLIPISSIHADQANPVHFEAQPHSYGRSYTVTLSVEGDPSQNVAIWQLRNQHRQGRALQRGGQQLAGELAFEPLYRIHGELVAGNGQLSTLGQSVQSIPASIIRETTRLSEKTVAMIRAKGVAGLYQETLNYIRWQRMQRGSK